MNRIILSLVLTLISAQAAPAMPVLFHEGVAIATPPVGENMSANRLIWQGLDGTLVVKVAHGDSARFFRFPGAFIRRGQVFIRNAHGLEGLVGHVGDADSATPPNFRIELDGITRLNIRTDGAVVVTEIAPLAGKGAAVVNAGARD